MNIYSCEKQSGGKNWQKSSGKHLQAIIISLLTLIMITSLASATDFSNWGSTPTSDPINAIRTYAQYAMASTSTQKIIFFNGSQWDEIPKPTYSFGGNVDSKFLFDKATDGKFHWALQNSSGTKEFWTYTPSSQTWSLDATSSNTEGVMYGFACIQDGDGYDASSTDMDCYWVNDTGVVRGFAGTAGQSITNTSATNQLIYSGYSYSTNSLAGGTEIFIHQITMGGTYGIYSWNGAGWTIRGQSSPPHHIYSVSQHDDTHFIVCYANGNLGRWSATLNDLYARNVGCSNVMSIIHQAGVYWASLTQFLKTSTYNSNTTIVDATTTSVIQSMDCAFSQENCWAGLQNGVFYHAGNLGITPPIDPAFNIVASANPNPSSYGTATSILATLTTTYGNPTYVQVEIRNSTGSSRDGFSGSTPYGNGVYDFSTIIQGISWQNFQSTPQTYTITANASDGVHTATYSFDWIVSANATTNLTQYNITQYASSGFSDVVALDNQGANRILAVGKNGSNALLISYDITNPNSIIRKSQVITGADTPTSISLSANRGYIGTNAKLFVYNNTQTGDATQATLNTPAVDYSGGSDYVYDTSAIDNDYSWTCGQNSNLWISDTAELFNYSLYDFQSSFNIDPCLTSHYTNGLILIHQGTGGVKIYNSTDQSLLGSTGTFLSQPSGATHDRISTFGNTMFAITAQIYITKYDITNPASPVEISRCYTGDWVQTIEALSSNEIVFGTSQELKACDFGNGNTYDPVNQFYTSTRLKLYSGGQNPTDIIALDNNGKFAVAEGNGIGIYFYSKAVVSVPNNQPPSIAVSPSTTTPCINQSVIFTISGSDPEGVLLDYIGDCTGLMNYMIGNANPDNQFTCTFNTAGVKTIKAFARESAIINNAVSAITSVNVQACSYSNFLRFDIRDDLDAFTPVDNVLVNVIGETSGLTNSGGVIEFNLPNSGNYNVSFSKAGWLSSTKQYTTSSNTNYVYLKRISNQGTILYVIVKDTQNNPIPLAHLTTTDPITSIAKFTDTDQTGTGTLTNMPSGTSFYVRATKDGYQPNSITTSLSNGETKTITITLLTATEVANKSSGRGCKDDINGVILCSPLNISFTGDTCTQDTDCISGRCGVGTLGNRLCSSFNWSKCDAEGLDRGNACFLRFTTQGFAKGTTDVILDNFLYVLIFIAVMIMLLMIMRAVSKY